MTAAGVDKGRLVRSISKSGELNRDSLSDWAVWSVGQGAIRCRCPDKQLRTLHRLSANVHKFPFREVSPNWA
jgi:hypothetical protein